MEIGLVGVGKMGSIIARRLLAAGHDVIGFDGDARACAAVEGLDAATSLGALVDALTPPRALWLMLPPGGPTQDTLSDLVGRLSSGDVVVDGGNSLYRQTVERAAELDGAGVDFVDVGVSGGVWGLELGFGALVGGDTAAVERVWPAILAIAADGGAAHVGPAGAGHFAKMIHNGVEYGVLQAYAEGYELLEAADVEVDVVAAMRVWARACSLRSFLLDQMVQALEQDPGFESVQGWVDDSGMGRWTVLDSVHYGVPAPTITAALQARFRSRQEQSPAMRALAAARKQIGGHAPKPSDGSAPEAVRAGTARS